MDSPSPLPHSLSASPTLASTGTVLPHDDQASKQLADQASHLTLSTAGSVPSSYLPTASSAPFAPICPHEGSPKSSRSRGRSCSAELGPSSSAAAAAAQRCCCLCCSPPISHEHAREATRMRDGAPAAASEDERRHIWPAAANAATADGADTSCPTCTIATEGSSSGVVPLTLAAFPNEVLLHILGYLDVSDLLAASRTSHQFRSLALAPILHRLRLRNARAILPPLLTSPQRPSLADLMHRHIFLTHTTVVSRRLARSLTAIRLSRRLATRPPPEALVARSVLPPECVPGQARVAPALVAKTRAVERERVKDGLRKWVGSVWERRWREKAEDRRRWEERSGVGRVWRLRRFWERVGRGEIEAR